MAGEADLIRCRPWVDELLNIPSASLERRWEKITVSDPAEAIKVTALLRLWTKRIEFVHFMVHHEQPEGCGKQGDNPLQKSRFVGLFARVIRMWPSFILLLLLGWPSRSTSRFTWF